MMRLYEFIELSKASGNHFFDKDTMRFFRSRILDYDPITGYFITSEKGPSNSRAYTLRKADFSSGDVDTIGQFQEYSTITRARTAFKRKLRG
jgi:hypothetical protein